MLDEFPLEDIDFVKVTDLKIQAMLFDMDIDWETLDLEPKVPEKRATWLTRWKSKQSEMDFDNNLDAEQE